MIGRQLFELYLWLPLRRCKIIVKYCIGNMTDVKFLLQIRNYNDFLKRRYSFSNFFQPWQDVKDLSFVRIFTDREQDLGFNLTETIHNRSWPKLNPARRPDTTDACSGKHRDSCFHKIGHIGSYAVS